MRAGERPPSFRLHAVLGGRVQGVGMRYFVLRAARSLQVTGWVRNLPDGGVEVEAEGSRRALEEFARVIRRGPSAALVVDFRETWSEREPRHSDFHILG